MTQEQQDLLDNWRIQLKHGWVSEKDTWSQHIMNLVEAIDIAAREDQKEKDIRIVADHFSLCGNIGKRQCKEHETALMNLIQNQ